MMLSTEFLKAEQERLAAGGTEVLPADVLRWYVPAEGHSAEQVAHRMISLWSAISTHVDDLRPSQAYELSFEDAIIFDKACHATMPDWIKPHFGPSGSAGPSEETDSALSEDQLAALSGADFGKLLDTLSEQQADQLPILSFWLIDFEKTNRTWFYAGHRVEQDRFGLCTQSYEDVGAGPALDGLLKICGAIPAKDGGFWSKIKKSVF